MYPTRMYFTIIMVFCERFSFSSLRCKLQKRFITINNAKIPTLHYFITAILPFYMRDVLLYDEREAIDIYHVFMILCYISAIIGGIVGNGDYGKYK